MRYWPRGVRRECFDRWERDLAPSATLLKDYRETHAHARGLPAPEDEEAHWAGFAERYRAELAANPRAQTLIAEVRERHRAGETITLLCGCHDPAHCHRSLLAALILSREA